MMKQSVFVLGLALGAGALFGGCEVEGEGLVNQQDFEVLSKKASGDFCGGFAGIECLDANEVCVDDPSDNCDPAKGGADCGGICVNGGNGGGNAGNGGNGNKPCKDTDTKTYVGNSLDECSLIHFFCADPDATYFADECGCGCEVCPSAPEGTFCTADYAPVDCGGCSYSNQCWATAAGYTTNECAVSI